MDSSLALKPLAAIAAADDRRPATAVRDAVAPELSPAQAVAATAKADESPSTAARPPAVVLDPQTRELAYRSADVRVRRRARQAAEKAMLRERAYARAARSEEHDGEGGFETTA